GVHVVDALDHAARGACRAVAGDHRGDAGAHRAADRIDLVRRVIPDAGANARIGEFHQYRRDATDTERDVVLEHAPMHGAWMMQRRLANRLAVVDLPAE